MKDHQESFAKKKPWESFRTRKEENPKLLSTLDLFQDPIPAQNSCYALRSPGNLPKPLCLFICNMSFVRFKSNDTCKALKKCYIRQLESIPGKQCVREGRDEWFNINININIFETFFLKCSIYKLKCINPSSMKFYKINAPI